MSLGKVHSDSLGMKIGNGIKMVALGHSAKPNKKLTNYSNEFNINKRKLLYGWNGDTYPIRNC